MCQPCLRSNHLIGNLARSHVSSREHHLREAVPTIDHVNIQLVSMVSLFVLFRILNLPGKSEGYKPKIPL